MSEAGDLLNILHAALTVELRESGADRDLCANAIYPGQAVPGDYGIETEGGCAGMAWVRLVSANPTTTFPAPATGVNNCTYTLAFPVEMAIMRASPIHTESLNDIDLPSDEEHIAAAHQQMDDLHLMHRAIKRASEDIEMLILGTYTPVGPTGGIVGGSWTLTVGN